jgi:hypothetical protein
MIAYRQNYAALQFTPKPKKRSNRRDPRTPLETPKGAAAPVVSALLDRIAAAIRIGLVGEAEFGRIVNRDPNLVSDLYAGRKIRAGTHARIIATLDRIEGGQAHG